jgi:asparagine synthase (glutamine-hydrolysing)
MCGIAGFWEFNKGSISSGNPRKLIINMLDSVKHRGPDGFGLSFYGYEKEIQIEEKRNNYYQSDTFVVLGHCRLSIIDLSDEAFQPMRDNYNSIEIVFNGEIYNYIELREELKSIYNFHTSSDTEVLIAAYKVWGSDMLPKLDGMFAIVIWDNEKKTLFCARDSMNIKPFYYNISPKGFIFGSEPKVVLEGLRTFGTLDKAHTSEFIISGISDVDDGTFYNEVKQLRGGHFFLITENNKAVSPLPFWAPPTINPDKISQDKISVEFYGILIEVMKRQVRSDVPIGLSLSGGLDSGSIAVLAGELMKENNNTYNALTFSSFNFDDDESHLAKSISEKSGLIWHQIIPSEESIEADLKDMIIKNGEPFTSLSMFAQYKVMQKASELGLKVILDGQGGDELYLGYPRLAQKAVFSYFYNCQLFKFWHEWNALKKNAGISKLKSLLYHIYFNSPRIAKYRNIKRASKFTSKIFLLNARVDVMNDLYKSKNIYEYQLDDLNKYCLPRLLRYADRNSMAFSIESRVPHLSNLIRDFVLSLPLKHRIKDGWTKFTLRKIMSGKLNDDVLWNTNKKGFNVPQSYWISLLESPLISWINEVNDGGIFNKKEIIKALKNDKRKGDFTLWRTISVISWMLHSKVAINND